jgi:1-acyl-sn-glycerol-3-phosphate acyltransferase
MCAQMGRLLSKALRVLLTGTAFLFFWTGGAVLSWLIIPWVSFTLRHDPVVRARRCREIICQAFRLHINYMRWCRLISFDPKSIEHQLPKTPFVLVANHPTLIDVVLLLASYPSICCVVKGALIRGPLIGRLLRQSDHIDAGDGSALAGAQVIEGAVERLRRGDPVLIFPEGTRSTAAGLNPFKSGAFAIACRADVPVIPVVIEASPRTLMKGIPWYTVPDRTVRFTMTVLHRVEPRLYGSNAKALKSEVQALLARHVGERAPVVERRSGPVPAL